MITEDYCSFEVAQLLKEKGFDGWCFGYYKPNNEFGTYVMPRTYSGVDGNYILAPTHQMAMKWLREIYSIEVAITHGFCNGEKELTYFWSIVKIADGYLGYPMQNPNSMEYTEVKAKAYKQAVEAALKYCLTNLIK